MATTSRKLSSRGSNPSYFRRVEAEELYRVTETSHTSQYFTFPTWGWWFYYWRISVWLWWCHYIPAEQRSADNGHELPLSKTKLKLSQNWRNYAKLSYQFRKFSNLYNFSFYLSRDTSIISQCQWDLTVNCILISLTSGPDFVFLWKGRKTSSKCVLLISSRLTFTLRLFGDITTKENTYATYSTCFMGRLRWCPLSFPSLSIHTRDKPCQHGM